MSEKHEYATECGMRRKGDPPPGTLVGKMQLPISYRVVHGLKKASDSAASRKSARALRGIPRHGKRILSGQS